MLEKNVDCIKRVTDEMVSNIEVEIAKEMAIELLPKIIKTIGLKSEDQLGRLTNMVRITSNTIQDRIKRNTNTRSLNFINTISESYQKVNVLNAKTCNPVVPNDSESVVKKKIKKAA